MHLPKLLIFIVLMLGCAYSHAQTTKSSKSSRFHVPKISKGKALIMCPIFIESRYPYHGLGLKLGDPFAATYKYYPSKHWAFAADAGKAASGLYNRYYRNAFNGYVSERFNLTGGETVKYLAHTALNDWFFETKFLYQWNAERIAQGLQVYSGLGWQWRSTSLQFDYLYDNPNIESKIGKFRENRFTYGPVAVVGFEYSYFTLPISAFIEIEWFTDAFLDPGYERFQGGVGLRYVF